MAGGTGSGGPAAEGLRERLERRLLAEPRPLPGARGIRTTLRTAHVIAFSALYGGHVYGLAGERLAPALAASVATGGALMVFEVYRAPRWLIQMRGAATLGKLALLASILLLWDWRLPLLTLVVVIGVVTSHMPGRYRYYSLLHGRPIGHGGNG
jgi:hypothetical protein